MSIRKYWGLGTLLSALLLTGCSDSNNGPTFPPGGISGGPTLAPPTAVNDAYTGRGNAQIITNAANGVLANDNLNTGAIASNTQPGHGAVALNPDGSFTYTPTSGFLGADSFTYTLANSSGNSTATVSLTLSGLSIFVNNQAAAGGDGSQALPFQTLAEAVTAATDLQGAQIVVFQGDGTTTGLNTPITLTAGQSIVGFSASAQPTLTGPIVFTTGNNLQDLRIIGTVGTAVNATGAVNGTLSDVTIANASGRALDMTNATGTFVFNGGSVSNIPAASLSAVIANCTTGSLAWSISNSTFTNNSADSTGCSVSGTANQTVSIASNNFIGGGSNSDDVDFLSGGNSTLAVNVTGNQVAGGGTAAIGVNFVSGGNSLFLSRVLDNTISGCRLQGIASIADGNSTAKVRLEDNFTTGNGVNEGISVGNGGTAQLFTTFSNNTSDQYNIVQEGAANLIVENLAAFTTNNTGLLNTLNNVVTAVGGSSGIP